MKIVVLAKQVPDTWSDRKINLESGMLDRAASEPVPDEINERALENALLMKDANKDVEVMVLAMGPEDASKALRKLLSMGADSAVLVSDPALAGSDMLQTSRVLASAIDKIGAVDLVLAGNEATDGRGGMVPAMVAEILGWPVLPGLDEVALTTNEVSGRAQVDGGTLRLSSGYPAVISVTERTAEARFPNFKGIMAAKKKPLETWSAADLRIAAGPEAAARSVMVSAAARPSKQAGPKVADDGTAAAQLADFLVTNRLI